MEGRVGAGGTETDGRRGERRQPRLALLTLLTAAFVLAAIEGLAFAFFRLAGDRFAFAEPGAYVARREDLDTLRRGFDAELGWCPRPGTPHGERRRPIEHGRAWMTSFGDSHTYGDEVGDADTWQSHLAGLAGADVYNFGVGGYGPDQALLRFRRVRGRPEAPVVALGIAFENVNRVVNRYRPFYSPSTGIRLTKPRFVLRDGRLELLANPVRSEAEIERLTDPAFVEAIGAADGWYTRGGLPRRGFPYARLLLSPAVWEQALEARRRNDTQARPLANLWKDEEARALFLAIVDAFVDEARAAGARPFLLFQPGRVLLEAQRDGRGIPGHRAMLEHCRARGLACFDGIAAISAEPEAADIDALSAPGGHLSGLGNRVLARTLRPWLDGQGLGPPGTAAGLPAGRPPH